MFGVARCLLRPLCKIYIQSGLTKHRKTPNHADLSIYRFNF